MALGDEILSRREVRLFPSHNISSDKEAELRATASLLAMVRSVSEFGKAIVSMAGGPKGKIRCYTEVPLKSKPDSFSKGCPKDCRFDGILRATFGKKDWTALVEVKVGNNSLEQEQLDQYHSMAVDHGINAVITISNKSALANQHPPGIKLKKALLNKVPVVHFSWARLLSEARLLSRQKAVADTDQQWLLDEWIRYLADSNSRIIEQPQLGKHWEEVLRYASENNLGACKNQMQDVVEHWNAFLSKVAFRLRSQLGVDVVHKISKAAKIDHDKHINNLLNAAIDDGQLKGTFHIPDAAGNLSVVVLLKSRRVQYSIDIEAPKEGKATTQIKWILKQLRQKEVPEYLQDIIVKVHWKWGTSSQKRVKDLQSKDLKDQTDMLLFDESGQKVAKDSSPKFFSLQWSIKIPKGKGRSTIPVLKGIADGIECFYKHVIEGLKPYVPKVPQLLQQIDEFAKDEKSNVIATAQQSKAEEPAIKDLSQECEFLQENDGNL